MDAIIRRLRSEPAFLGGVLTALVGLGTAFGLAWSGEQVGAVTGLIGFITGVGVRSQVSPANATRGDQDDFPVQPEGSWVDSPDSFPEV